MTGITYGSVCSGIEAASVAWEPLGWKSLWFSEIEPFPSAVLAHHWPQVPNLGDFTKIRDSLSNGSVEAPDVLVGGTPCQAYSVAGLRKSLDDSRGQLTLEFVRLADAIDSVRSVRGRTPCTIVWENVPGVLSTKDNAFGCFLGGLAGEDVPLEPPGGKWTDFGYVRGPRRTVAWRVLDAQYFGVAQRRRRVFVVASAGTISPEKVLFEFGGMRRDSPPSRKQGQGSSADVAPCIGASGRGFGRTGETRGQDPVVAVQGFQGDIARTLQARHDSSPCADRGMDVVAVQEVAATLRSGATSPASHGKLNGTDRMDLVVHTLAIRGRGDHRELETRDDGTSNALLLPNGGRDGIGCGAVAFQAIDYASGSFAEVDQASPITTSADRTRAAPIQVSGIPPFAGCLTTGEGYRLDPETTTMLPCFSPPLFDSLYIDGIRQGGYADASTQKRNSRAVLYALREEVGEEAFAKWVLGVLDPFHGSEILRQSVHGKGVRHSTQIQSWLVGVSCARQESSSQWSLFHLWENQRTGRPSRRWGSPEQLRRELDAYLQELSYTDTPTESFMHDLWESCEGSRVLRQALSKVQKVGEPSSCEEQPALGMQVRRLTPDECALLQGFSKGHARIPWRGKPAEDCPDGPQYKAYGNSMCVHVMRWIGRRLDQPLKGEK